MTSVDLAKIETSFILAQVFAIRLSKFGSKSEFSS